MNTTEAQTTELLLDGRYRLSSCVGRGGTALVYRAEDTMLGRTVAIKLLREADEASLEGERIRGESATLASLQHPSLVTLYDAKLEAGHPRYLVMEYVDGPTLSTRLLDGPLTPEDTAALAVDLAGALQTVHARGIVHRDVKPSNVLLAREPEGRWVAKLADFGIAYDPDDARVTSPGVAIGTAAYMAPEQVRAQEPTPATDIYALGLLLLEALTGRRAFPMTDGVQAALVRLTASPTIPEGVDDEWARMLEAMTAMDPGDRPTAVDVGRTAALLSRCATEAPAPASAHRHVASWGPGAAHEGAASSATEALIAASPADDAPGWTRELPAAHRRRPSPLHVRMQWAAALAGAAAIGVVVWGSSILLAPTRDALPDPARTPAAVIADPNELADRVDPADSGSAEEGTSPASGDQPGSTARTVLSEEAPVGDQAPAVTPVTRSGNGPDRNSGSGPDSNSGNGPGSNSGNGKGSGKGNGG